MENLIILGTGPAGLTAALYAARANLEPLVYEGNEPGGQLTTTTDVENYPGFESGVMGPDLVDIMRKQAQRFGTRCEYAKVVESDLSGEVKTLTLENGEVKACTSLIIATGASAKDLGIESEQKLLAGGGGGSACAVCDGAFYKDMAVCVIGGGDTAMEEALYLTTTDLGVTGTLSLLDGRDDITLATQADDGAGERLVDRLAFPAEQPVRTGQAHLLACP